MLKWGLVVVLLLAGSLGGLTLWGSRLPAGVFVSLAADFPASPEEVTAAFTDFEHLAAWRDDPLTVERTEGDVAHVRCSDGSRALLRWKITGTSGGRELQHDGLHGNDTWAVTFTASTKGCQVIARSSRRFEQPLERALLELSETSSPLETALRGLARHFGEVELDFVDLRPMKAIYGDRF